ncbi:MAG: peptide chain release factor N(5)-glutamine methyltransferase [Bacteroidaceae bacterium]|nr:peptide chain release factor N(5)-glutamine methyltransferase [Bacteroidaceae bacterium]
MKRITTRINEGLSGSYSTGEIAALTRIIATELFGVAQMAFYLKDDIALTAGQEALLDNAIERLKNQEPIQYILGYSDFCGLRFKVTPATLIPRPETSELVEWIAVDHSGKAASILDIGTGSGCIAVSLAHKLPQSKVTAWDISPDALAVATENSKANGCDVAFKQVDILTHEPTGEQFDVIVSNPPYIKENEKEAMHSNVLDWEPHTALFVPDSDPLLFYRAIAKKGLEILNPGGRLYFEINRAHGKETIEMLESLGYRSIELRKDFAENDRMIRAVKPKGKGESSCKRMGGNLFTHAMSEAEVQAHEVRLKVKSER